AKNFPVSMILAAPWVTLARYFWHSVYLLRGRGAAARFHAAGNSAARMPWYVLRAHFELARHAGWLWRQRQKIRADARITPAIFRHLVRSHWISARKVAAL